jgi:hypothetical protein
VLYRAFTDPSGGATSGDSYSLAVGHREDDRFVIDLVRGKQGPFDPFMLTKEFSDICKQFKITDIVGDNYAKMWPQQAWNNTGVTYTVSDLTASELYAEAEPLFMRGVVALPDDPVLSRELRLLERRPGNLAREAIGHPRGSHDDLANATAGVLRILSNYLGYNLDAISGWTPDDPLGVEGWRALHHRAMRQSILSHCGGRVYTDLSRTINKQELTNGPQ